MTDDTSDKKELADKNRLDLLLPEFLWEMGLWMTHGETKYGGQTWKAGEIASYEAALLRHVLQARCTFWDKETGLHHYAAIAVNAMILWWLEGNETSDVSGQCMCPTCVAHRTPTAQ